MTLPDAAWRRRGGLSALVDRLGGGETTRVVGGAVRDTLLGLEVSDIDMATRLSPREVMKRVEAAGLKAIPTGIAHGTVTAVLADGPVEITTLRRDVSTDGRHAEVEFTEEWIEDASRRDFTINALYADIATGQVFDWFGGIDDLAAHRVRFIGHPATRIAEDHLRILRFFRFHARFGAGSPDAEGYAACVARARDLMALSRERIAAELLKLLASADPVPAVTAMLEGSILQPVLPEIDLAGRDRLTALVAAEAAAGMAGDPVRRLIALMPDDAGVADTLVVRLRLSNAIKKRVVAVSRWPVFGDVRALAYRVGKPHARDVVLLRADPGAAGAALEELDREEVPMFTVSGGDLVARGLVPGPVVARTLRNIEDRWVEAGFPSGAQLESLIASAVTAASA